MVSTFIMKGVSPIAATLLLIVIAVAASLAVYAWMLGYMGYMKPSTPAPILGRPLLKIDGLEVLADEEKPEYAYAIRLYIRNIGGGLAHLANSSLYLLRNRSTVARGILVLFSEQPLVEIKPYSVSKVTYYLDSIITAGSYSLEIVSSEGAEAAAETTISYKLIGKTIVHRVAIENNETNKVVSEDQYAVYTSWCEQEDSNYKIWFNVSAKPGTTISAVRAELFSNNGAHPAWAGSNPYHWTTPYTYPDWVAGYWTPVSPEEMPVTIAYTIYVTKE